MKSSRARNTSDKENKRTLIMDTAIELFLNHSGKMPTASHVAEQSSMTKGNLYTYFKSKEELFFEILLNQYQGWFSEIHQLENFSFNLDTRLFEAFYQNQLLVSLCSLYHSQMKFSLTEYQKEFIEKMIRENLERLTVPISRDSKKSKSEIQILLYSSISLIIGAYHFQYEYEDGYNSLKPEDIYLPRLKVMWSIF
jgi:AcrR family transcriptional regulator